MAAEDSDKERRILRVLRIVLGNIVKDTTPQPGTPHVLRDTTIDSIRDLFALISERERELADQAGLNRNERPYFTDEQRTTATIQVHRRSRTRKLN